MWRLGNITIGRHARVAAGSLVLKPVPEGMMVAGSPATVIGAVADSECNGIGYENESMI